MKYLIHHGKFGMYSALFKFPILFSTVKFKLGRYSQFIYIFKIGPLNLGLRLSFQVFPNSERDWKLGFLNVALAGLLNFFQFIEELENWDIWTWAWTTFPNFYQFTKQLGNWDFWSPHAFLICQILRIVFQAGYM